MKTSLAEHIHAEFKQYGSTFREAMPALRKFEV
jgi:hypothetical protein